MKKRSYRKMAEDEESEKEEGNEIVRCKTDLFFYATVSQKNIRTLLGLVEEAKQEAYKWSTGRVTLYINTEGGDLHAGLSGMDHLEKQFQDCGLELWTVADGWVASAGTLLLLSGSRRFSMPHASLLVHSLSTYIEGKAQEILNEATNTRKLHNLVRDIYMQRCNLKKTEVISMLAKESMFTFKESMKMGFVEGELPPPLSRLNEHIRF